MAKAREDPALGLIIIIALEGTDEPILETLSEINTPWRNGPNGCPDLFWQSQSCDYRLIGLFGKAKNASPLAL